MYSGTISSRYNFSLEHYYWSRKKLFKICLIRFTEFGLVGVTDSYSGRQFLPLNECPANSVLLHLDDEKISRDNFFYLKISFFFRNNYFQNQFFQLFKSKILSGTISRRTQTVHFTNNFRFTGFGVKDSYIYTF